MTSTIFSVHNVEAYLRQRLDNVLHRPTVTENELLIDYESTEESGTVMNMKENVFNKIMEAAFNLQRFS